MRFRFCSIGPERDSEEGACAARAVHRGAAALPARAHGPPGDGGVLAAGALPRARLPEGRAAALVRGAVRDGDRGGGGVPAVEGGPDGRVPRQGSGALPGQPVADVARERRIGGRRGRGLRTFGAVRCLTRPVVFVFNLFILPQFSFR